MVTQNPSDQSNSSPTKPKKVWKPKPASAEGIPSMFASAALSKPLKVNATISNTVTRKTWKGASTSTAAVRDSAPSKPPMETEKHGSSNTSQPETASSTPASEQPLANDVSKPNPPPAKKVSKDVPKPTASTSSSKTTLNTTNKTTTNSKKTNNSIPNRSVPTSNDNHILVGDSTSVAGTPQSWPKPHNVPAASKRPIRNRFSKSGLVESDDGLHKNIDELIPEMYRKKSATELEKEQQEEIQQMRAIMWELRRQEQEQREKALQIKPVNQGIDIAMRILQGAKDQCRADSDSDSDATPKGASAYSRHMKSKLEYFTSNHSAAISSGWDDDSDNSSSVSSWESDDGLFRG